MPRKHSRNAYEISGKAINFRELTPSNVALGNDNGRLVLTHGKDGALSQELWLLGVTM